MLIIFPLKNTRISTIIFGEINLRVHYDTNVVIEIKYFKPFKSNFTN